MRGCKGYYSTSPAIKQAQNQEKRRRLQSIWICLRGIMGSCNMHRKYNGKPTEEHRKCRNSIAILQACAYNGRCREDPIAAEKPSVPRTDPGDIERRNAPWRIMLSAFLLT
jgi:hypothetical protein